MMHPINYLLVTIPNKHYRIEYIFLSAYDKVSKLRLANLRAPLEPHCPVFDQNPDFEWPYFRSNVLIDL